MSDARKYVLKEEVHLLFVLILLRLIGLPVFLYELDDWQVHLHHKVHKFVLFELFVNHDVLLL